MSRRRHVQIAPRLASGDARVPFGHGLPDEIKEGVRAIALNERKSMSYVMEEIIIDWVMSKARRHGLSVLRPQYKVKPSNGNGHAKA